MKAADLRDLTTEELEAKLKEVSEELFNLGFQHSRQQLDNTARLGQARKDLARIKTELRAKTGIKAIAGKVRNIWKQRGVSGRPR